MVVAERNHKLMESQTEQKETVLCLHQVVLLKEIIVTFNISIE